MGKIQKFRSFCFYTDGWGAYEQHLDPQQHQVGKAKTQKSERKHLLTRRE
jgi:insertion element IS1 protein InsB